MFSGVSNMGNSTKNYTAGKDLTTKPVFNGRDLKTASPVTVAIVRNIRARKTFTNGTDFAMAVTATIARKFPLKSRTSVRIAVYRALSRYFA
jgi:hypothetical protein